MLSIVRLSVCAHALPKASAGRLLPLARCTIQLQQAAGIKNRHIREPVEKPKPFPYATKRFFWYHDLIDKVESRFDENTKVIVLEGNIGVGKTALAKSLADELGMKYFGEPSFDQLYVDEYGFDLRSIDHLAPEACRTCDIQKFYEDPHNVNVASMQMIMFQLRFERYLDALVHLLNTGEGVVLKRSPFSDFVFAETMHKFGYISKLALKAYNLMKEAGLPELLRPHLVIYLDAPSNVLLQRIKERNIPYEVQSKVLAKEYLDEIDRLYKQSYLRSIRDNSELLLYDWTTIGEFELVVDDIERINFEALMDDPYGPMLKDWKKREDDWSQYRYDLTANKHTVMCTCLVPYFDAPELLVSGEDQETYHLLLKKFKRQVYAKGYNKHLGDKLPLFKTSYNYWDSLKLSFKDF
uniref:NADH dehydrogenase [ubiquinone] 1 alpha subcomplex subunit 10, mitochondrial n=1 Tax=Ixodes scapularis TaxID=6945 RepID=Q8MVA8_IXOSC|nr:putative secreted NADH-ubiquinone oxireductase [Ixodes scapularis]